MSVADGWDFTVPDDEAELMAELRRNGVRPGQRLRVVPVVATPGPEEETAVSATPHKRRLSFAGSVHAEPDLSDRVDDHLQGFGR